MIPMTGFLLQKIIFSFFSPNGAKYVDSNDANQVTTGGTLHDKYNNSNIAYSSHLFR